MKIWKKQIVTGQKSMQAINDNYFNPNRINEWLNSMNIGKKNYNDEVMQPKFYLI